MTTSDQADVDRFVDYFQSRLTEIKALKAEHAEIHRGPMRVRSISRGCARAPQEHGKSPRPDQSTEGCQRSRRITPP